MAAAKDISGDAAVASVLLEPDGSFTFFFFNWVDNISLLYSRLVRQKFS